MWQRILEDITGGRHEQALIRLWLWAEGTENGSQRLSVWRQSFGREEHFFKAETILAALERSPILLDADAANYPLAVIEALDRFLGLNPDLPGGRGSMTKVEEAGVGYWLLRRMPKPGVPADRQEPNLEKWFRHFRVLPDRIALGESAVEIDLVSVANPHGEDMTAPLSVRLSHFDDGVTTRFDERHESDTFWATGLDDEGKRLDSISAELKAIGVVRDRVWVAPELTVTPGLRERIGRLLASEPLKQLLIAVPGSFHETAEGRQVNRAAILDGDGAVLTHHEKLTLFSYPHAKTGRQTCECIVAQRRITLLATPIGLVGVAICKDFSDETATGLIQAVWNRLAPDWLLVPSMGDESTLRLHHACAESHAGLRGTRTAVANQQAFDKEPRPGFVCFKKGTIETVAPGGSSHASGAEK